MYKTLINGDIEFFNAPKNPLPLTNYTPDPQNPKLYRLALPVCSERQFTAEKRPCGAIVGVWYCKHYQRTISPEECRKCEKATEQ